MTDDSPQYEYIDSRGIKIADSHWTCPNCGDDGELVYNNGGLDRCATCFWVVDGPHNSYVLKDWPLTYRNAQRLLAALKEDWWGTPGTIGTRLHAHFETTTQLETEWRRVIRGIEFPSTETQNACLSDF
jgi:hypothetical protein